MKNLKEEIKNSKLMVTYNRIPLALIEDLKDGAIEGIYYEERNTIDINHFDLKKFVQILRVKNYTEDLSQGEALVIPPHTYAKIIDFDENSEMLLLEDVWYDDLRYELHISYFEREYTDVEFK